MFNSGTSADKKPFEQEGAPNIFREAYNGTSVIIVVLDNEKRS